MLSGRIRPHRPALPVVFPIHHVHGSLPGPGQLVQPRQRPFKFARKLLRVTHFLVPDLNHQHHLRIGQPGLHRPADNQQLAVYRRLSALPVDHVQHLKEEMPHNERTQRFGIRLWSHPQTREIH